MKRIRMYCQCLILWETYFFVNTLLRIMLNLSHSYAYVYRYNYQNTLTNQRRQMRRKMTQKRRLVREAHSLDPFPVPEDLNDDLN
jgi:hypothetical protein